MYRNLDYWKQRSILAEIKVENLESEVKRLKSSLLLYQDRERYWNQKYILEECKANITDHNARQSNKSAEEPSNYRPLSILPILSKVFERAAVDQIVTFLETNKLILRSL